MSLINNYPCFYWFVLKRCTTGTELGGKLPYSVMTKVMFSAGVTSYIIFKMFKFGISLHLLSLPTVGLYLVMERFVRSSGNATYGTHGLANCVYKSMLRRVPTKLIRHYAIQPNFICKFDALTAYNNRNLKLLRVHC